MKISLGKVSLIILLLLFSYIGYMILSIENNPFQKVDIVNPNKEVFEIKDLPFTTVENLYETFPYEDYTQKIDYNNFQLIDAHLVELDTITKSPFLSQSILSLALTTKLKQINYTNLDSLYSILLWADQFQNYSYKQPKYRDFYESIQSYWLNKVANTLTDISKENTGIKYNFKYRYLIQYCRERGFNIGGKVSKIEKIVIYFIDQKWSYLFARFWGGTSWVFKGMVFIAIAINLFLIGLGGKHIKLKYIK